MLSVGLLSVFTNEPISMGCSSVNIVVQWAAIKPIKVRFFILSSVLNSHGSLKETTCDSSGTMAKSVGKP